MTIWYSYLLFLQYLSKTCLVCFTLIFYSQRVSIVAFSIQTPKRTGESLTTITTTSLTTTRYRER